MLKKITHLLLFVCITSCSLGPDTENENIDYTATNEATILEYLSTNNLKAQKTASGLYYILHKQGAGVHPNSNSDVTITYKGYLTNGTEFDKNTNGIRFNLQRLIRGFSEGIQLLKGCGNITLLIPSRLGYGSNGTPGVPGGAVILFDASLITIH